ncbi:winged helix-turn-helix domain-containing protein [Deinococcus altitudinis]|uniref:winged helix-turn-helix domain-containing protein n=1 Tax=Deinococcus altitudinis TaxID=468914 RepID=UPI0038922FD1
MTVTKVNQSESPSWRLSSRRASRTEAASSVRAAPAAPAFTGPAVRLALDLNRRSVSRAGQSVPLTAKEFLLFELLYTSRGRLFSRDDILERVWGLDFLGETRIVDAYVRRLRSKLGADTVETVRGLGYRCPVPDPGDHLHLLSSEARLLTRLAERILRVTDPVQVIAGVYSLLADEYGVREVSLWTIPRPPPPQADRPQADPWLTTIRPTSTQTTSTQPTALQPGHTRPTGIWPTDLWPTPVLLAHAGTGPTELPGSELPPECWTAEQGWTTKQGWGELDGCPGLLLVPLGTEALRAEALGAGAAGSGTAGEAPWALLAFWDGMGRPVWPPETQSALEAVARLVHPALRLNEEISRREQTEQKMRLLNAELESRVKARTQALAQANADLGSLYALAQGLSGAGSLQEVLAHGLSMLAQIAGAEVCSLWRLHSTELHCLGAYTADHTDLTRTLAGQAPVLAALLRQSVACTPAQGVLTRTATLSAGPDGQAGREVLLIPVATALSEVHALHIELPGPVPGDLGLMDAAARAFGLAFERQLQTLTLEQVALNDELTGLPNRRALLTDLGAELSYSQRHRTSLTLSVFEIAGIRAVNRQHGFAAGSDLIRALADDLRSALRLEDRIYRLGGAVLVTLVRTVDLQERQALQLRLDTLQTGIGRTGIDTTGIDTTVALRIGHASSPDEGASLSDLLHLALTRLERGTDDPGSARPGGATPT